MIDGVRLTDTQRGFPVFLALLTLFPSIVHLFYFQLVSSRQFPVIDSSRVWEVPFVASGKYCMLDLGKLPAAQAQTAGTTR